MATAPSQNDLTRQQLDELDSLLQRMLALPINGPEAVPSSAPEPVAAVPNWRVDPPAPPPPPVQQFVAPPLPPVEPPRARAPEPAPFYFTPAPPPPAVTARTPQVRVLPEPPPPAPVAVVPPPEPAAPVVERKPAPPPPPAPKVVAKKPEVVAKTPAVAPAPESPGVGTSGSAVELRPPVPVVLWPLVVLNWVVDSALGLCGPPGWILRSGFGKNLLGLIGIGLLAYTAAHVAGRQGWVTLPFPLPWPK